MNTPTLTQGDKARAPWNEGRKQPISFSAKAYETLTHRCDVLADDYDVDIKNGDVDNFIDRSNVDWKEAYKQSSYTAVELINELRIRLEQEVMITENNGGQVGSRTLELLEACKGWDLEELEVEEA